ncbi:hypothetical protein H257_09882 [Aphanomyces astaci]|uniref:Kazal-like domain-containing protein n=1 Tax=Aphanomyces astaci TaxID=112090 RepID=W4G9F3_APHAT|nr:hypothetical protein H257_09882 [Aphanomyces astaci]ETV75921.1 hypothetical protein H257_09882 [Aphanomyces astaci]|eukprot:XP_009834563.1 hypothetical protein H257_09882 [Aphanomyces astaci]
MRLQYFAIAIATASAECEIACIEYYHPVCGSNNQTYANSCLLKVDACAAKQNITVASIGECPVELTCDTVCTKEVAPQCGSNNVTYGNQCLLDVATCKDPLVRWSGDGECNRPCMFACLDVYDPVCGSNMKTYGNDCELNYAACLAPGLVKVADGECSTHNTTKSPNVTSTTPLSTWTTTVMPGPLPPVTTVTSSAAGTLSPSVLATIVAPVTFLIAISTMNL